MNAPQAGSLLRRFFTGLAQHTFQVRLGMVDPPLIDYVGELLVRFARVDQLDRIRGPEGRPLMDIQRMLAEAEARIGLARRQIYRHIGDYALFWTGLFPERLQHRRKASDVDWYESYLMQGKRSYLIASSIAGTGEEEDAPSDLLARLGRQFELCAQGLHEVRRQWEQLEAGGEDGCLLIN